MNCKPGDLAIVVTPSERPPKMGAIVTVVRVNEDGHPVPAWVTEPEHFDTFGTAIAIPDSQLRPIRDPGDDARDEILRLLPHKEIA